MNKKINQKEKIRILERILERNESIYVIAKQYKVLPNTLSVWIEELFVEAKKTLKDSKEKEDLNDFDIEFVENYIGDLMIEYYNSRMEETCDWCGSPNVTYRDEAYKLCEFCAEQLYGD